MKSKSTYEMSVSYKRSMLSEPISTLVTRSSDAATYLREIYDEDKIEYCESFYALFLNRRNQIFGYNQISSGGITGTVADPRMILQLALLSNATGIILSHNHPSGQLKPSAQDLALTQKVKNAASFMDIQITDHIIMTKESFYSFADEGQL